MTRLLLPVFLISCYGKKKEAAAATPRNANGGNMAIQADGFVVRTKSLSENLEVPGTILPFEQTEIRPEISGRVVQLNIREGGFVRKGDLLVKLFDEDLQAQLKKLQVQLAISQKTAEREAELLKINGISQQDYDLSALQVSNNKADIESTEVAISKTEIRAPFDGKIGLRQISMGAYVSPTTLISTISQVKQLKLEFTVPEKYSEMMKTGNKVNFTMSGTGGKYTAAILATEANVEADTRTLKVRAVVNGKDPAITPGSFAKVILSMNHDDKAMIVPTQAIIPQARNKVVVLYNSGKAKYQVVTTGIRDSTFIQVLDGLHPGDTIVTTGLMSIRPDNKVALSKVQ